MVIETSIKGAPIILTPSSSAELFSLRNEGNEVDVSSKMKEIPDDLEQNYDQVCDWLHLWRRALATKLIKSSTLPTEW